MNNTAQQQTWYYRKGGLASKSPFFPKTAAPSAAFFFVEF